ncbi:MAG TPA: polysaccharide biosynthesis/export family protein [Terriglobales bacterium]|nr:polysaccharide biosynthesis/export family protein [Terriglobales bacterium]
MFLVRRNLLLFCLHLACLGFPFTLTAQLASPSAPPTVQPVDTQRSSEIDSSNPAPPKLRIGGGDLIEVSVYGVSDFKEDVRVNDAGEVSLPLIGSVIVGGSTPEEARALIARKLVEGGFFRDPNVELFVKEYSSQAVSIMGEVMKPGVYPLLSTRRLYDVISLAGGLTPKAGKLVTVTHRDQPQNPIEVNFSNDPAKSIESNVEIYPGDTVVVAKAGIVYVVGDVGRPGGFIMENGEKMTVLQVIAMAQGPNRTAAMNGSRLLRKGASGITETPVPLKEILSAKAHDMDLQPDDILFVPVSTGKTVARVSVQTIVSIASGLALVGATH